MARNKVVISEKTKKVAGTLATMVYIAIGVFSAITLLSASRAGLQFGFLF